MHGIESQIPEMKIDKLARHRRESFADSQKSASERVKHRLTNVEPKGDPRYPKVKYHPHRDHVVVKDAEDEAKRTPAAAGWVDSPADFPPSAVREFANDEKLAMFEEMAQMLGVEPGQSPVDVLADFQKLFNEFAQQVASRSLAEFEREIAPDNGKKKRG